MQSSNAVKTLYVTATENFSKSHTFGIMSLYASVSDNGRFGACRIAFACRTSTHGCCIERKRSNPARNDDKGLN